MVSLYSPGCPGTHSVDQAGLHLRNAPAPASQVSQWWHVPPLPGQIVISHHVSARRSKRTFNCQVIYFHPTPIFKTHSQACTHMYKCTHIHAHIHTHFKVFVIIVCGCLLSCISVHHVHAVLSETREGITFPGTGMTDDCKLLCWALNLLSTSESSPL